MAVLVTRPLPDGEATAASLRARGFAAMSAPMLRFEPLPFHDDEDAQYGAVIVTSANALRGIEPQLAGTALLKLPLFAVGEHTADAARQAGFTKVMTAKGDASTLRDLVAESAQSRKLKKKDPLALSRRRGSRARSCDRTRRKGFFGGDADHLQDGSGKDPAARGLRRLCGRRDRGGAALLPPQRAGVSGCGAGRRCRNIGAGAAAMLHFGRRRRHCPRSRRRPGGGRRVRRTKMPCSRPWHGLCGPDSALCYGLNGTEAENRCRIAADHALRRRADSAKVPAFEIEEPAMVDDRPEDNGPLGESGRPKREPPTIDLKATEVSETPKETGRRPRRRKPARRRKHVASRACAGTGLCGNRSEPVSKPVSQPSLPWAIAPISGAVAATLVIAVGWALGWPTVQAPAPAPQINAAAIDDLTARIAGLETKTSKPAAPMADPAAAARIETIEKSLATLRGELASHAGAGRQTCIRDQRREGGAARRRCARGRSLRHQRAHRRDRTRHRAPRAAEIDAARRQDRRGKTGRRQTGGRSAVAAAGGLGPARRSGAGRRSLCRGAGGDEIAHAKCRRAEAARCVCGVPACRTSNALCRELLTIVPKLNPPAADTTATTGTGIVDRLQAGASKLVRVQRADATGDDRGSVVARVTAAGLRNDLAEARRELNTLQPADRAPAQAWLDKADARDAALAASRKFASRRDGRARSSQRNRVFMVRIILFLGLIALAAAGAAWVADQTGDVSLSWGGWRIETTIPVFALGLGLTIAAGMLVWAILRGLWKMPAQMRRKRHERRHARGRHAITQGLLAIGHGDSSAARRHADDARRHAAHDPLALLLDGAIGAARRRPRGRAARVPRHGRARGHAAPGPARAVRRSAARRRSAVRRDDRG